MEIKMRTYIDRGDTVREQQVPPMFVVVDTYHPHSCPWDCYGNKHTSELKKVLLAVGIEAVSLVESRTKNSPHGSGPGGRVRFGDNMTPGVYRVAVAEYQVAAAKAALAAHKVEVEEWIDGKRATMPEACYSA
jgi:hypothetical protein